MPNFTDSIDTEALTTKYKNKNLAPFKVLRIDKVNFKPHPFMIGPRHVTDASNHHGGMLGLATIEKIPCAAPDCRRYAQDHTYDVVLMVQLTREATQAEVKAVLQPIGAEMEADKIDGVTFVDTPQKYRMV